MKKMGFPARKDDMHYTYGDYRTWPDDERWELIHGVAYNMSPAPNTSHQQVSVNLASRIWAFLENRSCRVLAAPFDVFFPQVPADRDDESSLDPIDTVVQPDISVICEPAKIIDRGCLGAPDLLVEILSPGTSRKDLNEKYSLYEAHGVREYWVIDPATPYVQVYRLGENGRYPEAELYVRETGRTQVTQVIVSHVLDGFSVGFEDIFKK